MENGQLWRKEGGEALALQLPSIFYYYKTTIYGIEYKRGSVMLSLWQVWLSMLLVFVPQIDHYIIFTLRRNNNNSNISQCEIIKQTYFYIREPQE